MAVDPEGSRGTRSLAPTDQAALKGQCGVHSLHIQWDQSPGLKLREGPTCLHSSHEDPIGLLQARSVCGSHRKTEV